MGFKGLMTGVSGLKAQSKKMEVIGNNLANVNTTGYKKDRVNFQDVYYQVAQHATGGDGADVGGTNGQEIGMGVQIGSIDKIFTQGVKNTTGRTFDFMIEGDDFFVAKNSATSELMLTRNGAFQMDGDMNLVDSMGNKVQGFNVDRETLVVDTSATNIQVQSGSLEAKATTQVNLQDNIDSSIVATSSTSTTNAWEVFSAGENFGKMNAAVTGLAGERTAFGSGYYQDSMNYTDSTATLDAGGLSVTLGAAPTNLAEGFSVGDTVSVLQGSNQMQRTITAIAGNVVTLNSVAPGTFTTGTTVTISNLTDGTSNRGTSGSTAIHSDVLRSEIAMVDQNGRILASFYRVSGMANEYARASATITGGGGTVTMGTGEFTSINDLKELIERTLRDTQLTNYAASNDMDITLDKFGQVNFGGTGLVNEFRLVMNADNTEMLDRFSGIAMTDNGTTATTQARIDASGEIITAPSLALGARTTSSSKNWFDTSGLENYGFSDTNAATEYGEYAGLRLDGGTGGAGYGVLQLSLTNALGATVTQEFKLVARDADPSNNQFSTMGELAGLIQSTLRSSDFSSIAEDSVLVSDSTATVTMDEGRLKITTSNGSFRDLVISPVNVSADTSAGITRTDDANFGTVLGALAEGINGKEGISNQFIDADVRTQTRVYDSQGNEHTAVTYLVRDRSAGLTNIEWKFRNSLQPNVNTFSDDAPDDKSIYRDTFNSIQDTSSSRGVIGFDISTGSVLDSSATNADSRYSQAGTLTFIAQDQSVEANTSSITLDFTSLTSFNGDNTVVGTNVDGYAIGNLIRMTSEDVTGDIIGVYSNGQTRTLAKLGLMHVDNPEGLRKNGSSYFVQTANTNQSGLIKGLDSIFSTTPSVGTSTDSIDSKIYGNSLEASNVDISEELTDMIVTQRSYSASGKTITTLDDMIQEALSLKR